MLCQTTHSGYNMRIKKNKSPIPFTKPYQSHERMDLNNRALDHQLVEHSLLYYLMFVDSSLGFCIRVLVTATLRAWKRKTNTLFGVQGIPN